MKQFGFIGMGNMGYAILKGLLKTVAPDQLIFSARNKAHMEQMAAETGVSYAADNVSCAKESSCLVLAVKPQQFDTIIGEIRDAVTEEQIIISIAPGITIENLQARFGKKCRIVRAMPNTPALVGEGMTGVCYDQALFSEEEKQTIETLFTSFGRMTIVEEKLMDAVVCASGSSPAYVYMFIEALADSAVQAGGPDRAWKRKDGAGDRRASGTLKRQGLLPGRNHHCRSGCPGGVWHAQCRDQGNRCLLRKM